MSAAARAKSPRARATIALRLLRTVKDIHNHRPFDDCFEMLDGDDVVAHIIKQAAKDVTIARLLALRGFAYWLEPGYLARMTCAPRSNNVLEAMALQDSTARTYE